MASKRKRAPGAGRLLWRTLLASSCIVAVSFLPNLPAHAQTLEELNAEIIQHPDDSRLNLLYAHEAEKEGKLRLALAAYERILINDPNNVEAQRGYEHVRRVLQPPNTTLRVEVGEQWDTNPADVSADAKSDFVTTARGTWVNEREFDARRWRTYVNFDADLYADQSDLNYAYASLSVGPMFDLTPNIAAIPALGVAISSFNNRFYYDEVNAGVTFEGHRDSATYWSRLRAGWRDYGKNSTSNQGPYVELMGGLSQPRIFGADDWIVAVPWLRWSNVNGQSNDLNNDPIAPGQYTELGVEATYNYRFNDHWSAGIGAEFRDRYYATTEVSGNHRHDAYAAPEASLTLWNPVGCSCGVTLNYRYRHNQSNDPLSKYDGQNVSLTVSREF
jgi:hypothetical protein